MINIERSYLNSEFFIIEKMTEGYPSYGNMISLNDDELLELYNKLEPIVTEIKQRIEDAKNQRQCQVL